MEKTRALAITSHYDYKSQVLGGRSAASEDEGP